MISLYDILKAANGQLFGEPVAQLFTDFCVDPRQAGESLLYVALPSDQGDVHQRIEEAVRRGVSGVVCHGPPECDTEGVSVLMVKNSIDALVAWAHFTLGKSGVKVIGVAGSSGKSTTAEVIHRILSLRYQVHRGNVDAQGPLGMALSLARLKPEHQFVVLKLDSTAPGDMAEMVQAIQPDAGVLTHLDCIHPPSFRSCEQYSSENRILLDYLSPGGLAVVNYDDDAVMQVASSIRAQVRTFGMDRFGADVMAFNIVIGMARTGFDLRVGASRYVGRWTPLLGRHQLSSILAALTLGLHYDISMDEMLPALTEFYPLPGRMNSVQLPSGALIIDDSHQATTQSTVDALDWLGSVRAEAHRVFLVLGDMFGGMREAYADIGEQAAQVADALITQGADAALIGAAAVEAGMNRTAVHSTYTASDTAAIIQRLNPKTGDIVLVKGGWSARMEQVVSQMLPPDQAREILVRQDDSALLLNAVDRRLQTNWLEIDPAILAANVRAIKSYLAPDVTMMAVVKANGYGHGAVMAARTALLNGAGYLAVASVTEALALRDAGIHAPILVLSYLPTHAVQQAIQQRITATVFDLEIAQQYNRAARDVGDKLRYHVKLDTGMGRLGMLPDEAIGVFRHLAAFKHIELEGIYTHFASADTDPEFTQKQVESFKRVIRPLRAAGFQFKYIHAANSPGTLTVPDPFFNMVRPGLMMYGLRPGPAMPWLDELKPLMTWKTSVLQVKTLRQGHSVGYGRTYTTQGDERIAILPIGYADGFRRTPHTWREVLLHGQRAPVIGRVSMEKCAIRVTHIPGVMSGDEVVLLGRQGDDEISADEIAEWLQTINYEVLTTIAPAFVRH